MTILALFLASALAQRPADPSDLARRLGSARFAEREQSGRDLQAAGEAAIPALREAATSRDLEQKTRATALLRRVEAVVASTPETMVRPTFVRLGPVDATVVEALDSFDGALEGRVVLTPDAADAARGRRLTVRNARPVPFWTAIDQLARAGDLRVLAGTAVGAGAVPRFRLALAPGFVDAPRSDSGPLRLVVDEIRHRRAIQLTPTDLDRSTGVDFQVAMQLLAEPRLLLGRVGPARVLEAVDDLGRSLPDATPPEPRGRPDGSQPARASVPVTVGLGRPRGGGRAIRSLRLSVPVEVLARRPEPTVIPLDGPTGREYRVGPTTIRPLAVEAGSAGPSRVRLAFRTDPEPPDRRLPAPPARAGLAPPPDLSINILDVLDPHGHLIPWVGGVTPSPEPGPEWFAELTTWGGGLVSESRGRPVLPPEEYATALPATIHYYGYARAVIVATFAFRDLPMP